MFRASDRETPRNGQQPKVPSEHVPAKLLQRHIKDAWQTAWPSGGVPGGGEAALPHIFTVAGRYGIASRTYSIGDEALIDSRENALMMRNELAIMECLEARMRSTQLLPWHIGPGDEALDNRTREVLRMSGYGVMNHWNAEELAAKVSLILSRTRNLDKLFRSLMEAIWYGRYATEQMWASTSIAGLSNRAMYIDHWEPRHGDKLVFRYDDGTMQYDPKQIGIRVGPGYDLQKSYTDYGGNEHRQVEATQFGLTYFLTGAERKRYAVHKHMIEDGDYARPLQAGNIHGVGIRSRIYWSWYAYTESLKLLMEYLERSALGIEIWRYPAHNPTAKAAATEAAQRRGAPGRSILMVPVPEGEQASMYDVEIVEPGLQGAEVLQNVLEKFFGHKIKRYILGQTLTTEADATGLGSGMADLHAATYSDIVRSDSLSLADTITHDIVRMIQLLNFPGSEGIFLRFSFDTESPLMQSKLDAYRQLWEMGAKVKTDDLYRTIGASRPNEGDDTLLNPAYMPDPAMGMEGEQQMMGLQEEDGAGSQDMMAPALEQFGADPFIKSEPRYQQPIQIDRYAEPTKAQKEAGNYKMRHFAWNGMKISIENEVGSIRKFKGGQQTMKNAYGYICGSEGADGDLIDCFIGPDMDSEIVFVIDQVGKKGVRFDEHKCVLGAKSREQAKRLYLSNYQRGWKCGPTTGMTLEQFKTWLEKGDQTKRVSGQVSKFSGQASFDFGSEPDVDKSEKPEFADGEIQTGDSGPLVHHQGQWHQPEGMPQTVQRRPLFDDPDSKRLEDHKLHFYNDRTEEITDHHGKAFGWTQAGDSVKGRHYENLEGIDEKWAKKSIKDLGDPVKFSPLSDEEYNKSFERPEFKINETLDKEPSGKWIHVNGNPAIELGRRGQKIFLAFPQESTYGHTEYETSLRKRDNVNTSPMTKKQVRQHKQSVEDKQSVNLYGRKFESASELSESDLVAGWDDRHLKWMAENGRANAKTRRALTEAHIQRSKGGSKPQKPKAEDQDDKHWLDDDDEQRTMFAMEMNQADIDRHAQSAFDFDERPKEKAAAASKKKAEDASVHNKHGESQKGLFENDFKPSKMTPEDRMDKKHPLSDSDLFDAEDDEDEDIEQYATMEHSPEDINVANATSRSGGAVGGHPITIKYVSQFAKPGSKVLDFGAGKQAAQAKELKAAGMDVTAYDFGHNATEGVHDPAALDRQYDVVYASNVLNVQESMHDLTNTVEEIAGSVVSGGVFIGNLPSTPRKGAYNSVHGETAASVVKTLLEKHIGPTEILEGGTSSPVFKSVKNQTEKYANDGICDEYDKINGKPSCKVTRLSINELIETIDAEIERFKND